MLETLDSGWVTTGPRTHELAGRIAQLAGARHGLAVNSATGALHLALVALGVGRGDARRDLADHVLARFEKDEQPGIEGGIARAADAVEAWTDQGFDTVMNAFNRAVEEGT